MNRYILIRRLRVPAFLLLIGVLALFHTMGLLEHFWRLFWPLAFILAGLIMLAERADGVWKHVHPRLSSMAEAGGFPPERDSGAAGQAAAP